MKKLAFVLMFILVFSLNAVPACRQAGAEDVTITTYYPAPSGVYKELRAETVGIGTTNPITPFEVASTADGILIPRMTMDQMNAIPIGPNVNSLLVYVDDTPHSNDGYYYYNHFASPPGWVRLLSGAGGGSWWDSDNGTDIYNTNIGGRVGIGVTDPCSGYSLEIAGLANTEDGIVIRKQGIVSSSNIAWVLSHRYNSTNNTNKDFFLYGFDGTNFWNPMETYWDNRVVALTPNSNGRVGIGTTNPQNKLQIHTPTPNDHLLITGTSPAIQFSNVETGTEKLSLGLATNQNDFYTGTKAGDIVMRVWDNGDFYITKNNQYGAFQMMRINANGNVGIGVPFQTAEPQAKLHVYGNIKAALSPLTNADHAVQWGSSTAEIGYDIAELFKSNEIVEPGDVLCIDKDGNLKKSEKSYDTKVAGIVSEAPAIVFEGSELQIAPKPFQFKKGEKPPIALVGRVKCKVTTENGGPIDVGDLLVTSSKNGYAMKADTDKLGFGMIIGKALEPLEKGEGKIVVLINLQ